MAGAKDKRKRKRTTKPDNPAQSARFVAAAKRAGLGGKGDEFERAMDKLAPRKK
jgi:hypothetical protein